MPRRNTAIVCLFVAASSFAQVPPEEQPVPETPVLEAPAPHMRDALVLESRRVEVQATQASPLDLTGDATSETLLRFFEGTVERSRIESVGTGNTVLPQFAGSFRLWNTTSAPMIFGTDGIERMRIHADGNVSVGYAGNNGRLAAVNYADLGRAMFAHQNSTIESNVSQNDYGIVVDAINTIPSASVTNGGSIVGAYIGGYNHGPGTLAATFGSRLFSGNPTGKAGTVTNAYGVHVQVITGAGTVTNGYGAYLADVQAVNDYGFYQAGTDDDNYFAGRLGIGRIPTDRLNIYENANVNTIVMAENPWVGDTAAAVFNARSDVGGVSVIAHSSARTLVRFGRTLGGFTEVLSYNGNGLILGSSTNTPLVLGTNNLSRVYVEPGGDVGIGIDDPQAKLHVNGNVLVSGNLTAVNGVIGALYQDVAEWVPATVDMEPGTVVVLNHERNNEVMPSHSAYDTSVAGVVSAQPGVLLGVAGDSKEQIATTGRVKVRVDATRGPIRVGDLLVTSDVAGTAMRSEPMDINGRRFHQPGTIIGKALEPLASGTGEILVLLSMQ